MEKGNNVVVKEPAGVAPRKTGGTRHEFLGYFLVKDVAHAFLSWLARYVLDFIAMLPHVVC